MSKLQRHVQCYDAYAPLDMVQRCIREGHHVMVLMRGIPGSGKTYLAKFLLSNYGGVVCSTDDFFIVNGEYRFEPEKLEEYHRSNILRVREAMKEGIKPIIVDNTNIFTNHMEQYAFHAVTHCYEIFVVEPETSWKYAVKECFRRNVHGVDKSKIHAMLQSLEEQGRPSLSRLVGKGRQVKLEPPCDGLEHGFDEQFFLATPSFAPPALNNGSLSSSKVTTTDRPPGLPDPNAISIFAKLFPENAAPASSPSVSLSLALDPRPNIRMVTLRDMATQTNEVVVTLTCAGIPCQLEDLVEGPSRSVERIKDSKVHMKDRVVKMENIPQVSELDVLIAIFPYEEINNLIHYYQMLGFDECVKFFVELGAYVDWSASVVEGAFREDIAALEMSATCPHAPPARTDWQRIAEQEGMNDRSDKSAGMSPTQADPPRPPSPSANAITVTLGVDILQKMSVLFGNGMAIEQECNLSVPLWLLEQLYLVWQGGVRKVQQDTDAELASILQEGEHDEASSSFVKNQMTVAQKLNLNELVKEFSSCDSECVRRIFEDNGYDAAATRVTLRVMLNPDADIENLEHISAATSEASKQVLPPPLSRTRPTRTEAILPLAQEQALQCQRQADEYAAKRSVETRKAQGYIRSGLVPAAAVYQQIAREYAVREKDLRARATDLILKAHEHSNFLDLHLLSQKDALALLRERLELLDRPESMRNGRSDRRLRVITGYGKSSGGRAVIKPAVESYLRRNSYIFDRSLLQR